MMKLMSELWNRLLHDPLTARKFVTAVVGAAITAASVGLLPDSVNTYAAVIVPFLTAMGVYYVPNEQETENE